MRLFLLLYIPVILFTQESTNTILDSTNQQIKVIDSNTVVIEDNISNLASNIALVLPEEMSNTNDTLSIEKEQHTQDLWKNHYTPPFSVEDIFKAMIMSYPTIVKPVSKTDNPYYPELAINIRGTNFYNVHGRFLPEEDRKHWKKYSSNSIYVYNKEILNPLTRTSEEIKQLRHQGSKSYRKRKKPTHYKFHEALYGMDSLSDTNQHIKKSYFLKKQILIHEFAYEPLKQIEKEIYALTNHPTYKMEVNRFLKEGDTVYSFFWRRIAGTKSRSLHSYGVAIDILKENSTKAMYWLWRQNQKIDWLREPISVRWNPPNSVVEIFEKYGFVWGGKWTFYDTMHFEYKPEILILNNYNVTFLPLESEE